MPMPIHVFDQGTGRAIVLLHGLPSPPGELEAVAAALAPYRVLVPHLPGYGRSSANPGAHGVVAVEDALCAALDVRGVEAPILVGFSMGGYRALSLALRRPASAVVVLAGFADLSTEERAGMRGFAELLEAGEDLRPVLPGRILTAAHRKRRPGDDAVVASWVDCAPAWVLAEELRDLETAPSLLHRLAELRCPVVARTGEVDLAMPPHHARDIAAAARHGAFEIVPGVGHGLFLEDGPGTIASILRVAGS